MVKTCAVCGLEAEPVRDEAGKRTCPGCGAAMKPGATAAGLARAQEASQGDPSGPRRTRASAGENTVEAGSVFAPSIQVWMGNLVPFLGVSVVVLSPLLLHGILHAARDPEELTQAEAERYDTVHSVLGGLLNLLVTAAVVGGVFQVLRGQKVSLGPLLSAGIKRVLPCLWTGIFAGACTYAPLVPGILLIALGASSGTGAIAVGGLLSIAGLILVLYLSSALFVAIPVSVIEKVNGFGAVRRSWGLTKGSRGQIFVILLGLGILGAIFGFVMKFTGSYRFTVLASLGWAVVGASFGAVFSGVVYYRLRKSKEGVGLEDLAKVFE